MSQCRAASDTYLMLMFFAPYSRECVRDLLDDHGGLIDGPYWPVIGRRWRGASVCEGELTGASSLLTEVSTG